MKIVYNITLDLGDPYMHKLPSHDQMCSCFRESIKKDFGISLNGIALKVSHVEYSEDPYDKFRQSLSQCRFPLGGKQRQKAVLQDLIDKAQNILDIENLDKQKEI